MAEERRKAGLVVVVKRVVDSGEFLGLLIRPQPLLDDQLGLVGLDLCLEWE